jgi:hypothetical protein
MKQIGEAGLRWRTAAIDAGAGRNTHLHCLGDGAKAIARQVTEQFGSQARYLLDFYHASEYLAEAAERIAGGGQQARLWLRAKQEQLRDNRAAEVIAELFKEREAEDLAEEASPVRRSYRYLSERREYLDYKGAIEAGLPIGSGEIEGGHRSVVQARLKKSGAWWNRECREDALAQGLQGKWRMEFLLATDSSSRRLALSNSCITVDFTRSITLLAVAHRTETGVRSYSSPLIVVANQ